jgi:hypothetical protein
LSLSPHFTWAAKASVDFAALAARLKSRPFKPDRDLSFQQRPALLPNSQRELSS